MTRCVLVMGGLELAYLILANSVLRTRLARMAVESARGLKLNYAAAYSLLPGRISVRGLSLRFEDFNVQFQLTISRAEFDLSLHEMLNRKFHVLGIRAQEVAFLLRHKVESPDKKEDRLAAFPHIEGYQDPPLYRGARPASVSDDAARKLWEVRVDDVIAEATELWILEYRFRGRAEARGSFLLRPTRWVEVTPGTIHFTSGSLTAGVNRVAESIQGTVFCSVPGFDVRSAPGIRVFSHLSGSADLLLSGGTLDFMNLYFSPQVGVTLTGPLRAEAHVRLERGVLVPGTLVRMHADSSRVDFGPVELAGHLEASLTRNAQQEQLNFHLKALQSTFENKRSRSTIQAPVLEQLLADVAIGEANVTGSMKVSDVSLSLRASVPDFAWLDAFFARKPGFRGTGDLSLAFRRDPHGLGEGRLLLDVSDAGIMTETGRLRLSGNGVAQFRTTELPRPYAQGALSLRLKGAESLLAVTLDPALQTIVGSVLDLGALEANVAFHLSKLLVQLELTSLRGGNLDARGQVRSSRFGPPRGALLLSSGALRLGVTVDQGRIGLSPLVGQDWLERTLRTMGQSRPEGDAGVQ